MTLNLVEVELWARTSQGNLAYRTRFSSGLNVLVAPNTWGKSTLMQGIVYALGLEGMFSASRKSPLGEAMTSVADTNVGRLPILESRVTLTLKNSRDQFMRVRRHSLSLDLDSRLIQTWTASSYEGLAEARQVDTFVRDSGAAVRELGFHYTLAHFLEWQLPRVPTYSGGESPLYLELLFPLFYVEQKFGWSGVAPRVPTYLRVRDPLRRAVEYVLGLSTLQRINQRTALTDEIAEIRSQWSNLYGRAREAAEAQNWFLSFLPPQPVSVAAFREGIIEVPVGEAQVPLQGLMTDWRVELAAGDDSSLATAGDRTSATRIELREAEGRLRSMSSRLRLSQEEIGILRADLDSISGKLAQTEANKRRLADVVRLQQLGSQLDLALVSDARCPTCEQDLDGRHVVTGIVTSVGDSQALADAERTTLVDLRATTEKRLEAARVRARAIQADVGGLRSRIRELKDELTSPSSSPSYTEVRRRLKLADQIAAAERVSEVVLDTHEALHALADRYDNARDALGILAQQDEDPRDARTIGDFQRRFREQVRSYGLKSLPPEDITIDGTTFLPTSDGVELAFDVSMGLSASDAVRTKWAYYSALLEAATAADGGHHAQLLMLDEPRQQETEYSSLEAFLTRLSEDAEAGQIIYATSDRQQLLDSMLSRLAHTRLPAPGNHLLGFDTE